MTAETLSNAHDGRKVGTAWMARCPAHDDREPSLSISASDQGKVLGRPSELSPTATDMQSEFAAMAAQTANPPPGRIGGGSIEGELGGAQFDTHDKAKIGRVVA